MKARVKGTDDPFRDIETVEIKDVCGIYFANDMEFETTPDHWQDVRERAAIAVFPQFVKTTMEILSQGGEIKMDVKELAATNAVVYADALIRKLKGE